MKMDLMNFLFNKSAAKDTDELWNLLLKGLDYYDFDLFQIVPKPVWPASCPKGLPQGERIFAALYVQNSGFLFLR